VSDHYVLNADHSTRPASLMEWAAAFEDRASRRVASTTLPDGTYISTVFLGLDHSFGEGPPQIFETMVFPSADDLNEELCWRYATWDEAEAGHERAVALAIETRSAETVGLGPEDKSAVGKAEAPTISQESDNG